MPYIEVTNYEDSTGELRTIYDSLIASRGKLANVHMIQSLNPESIVKHMELYMTIMFGQSPLKRYQREMIGVVVSKANDCAYCISHHAEALNHFWKDDRKLGTFIADFQQADISEEDLALCHYAWKLTRKPWKQQDGSLADKLRRNDFSDRAILDASLVVSYFNFVNRLVISLGVVPETDTGGYSYD
jgi:uncharacterized peroxidase-related enzyme